MATKRFRNEHSPVAIEAVTRMGLAVEADHDNRSSMLEDLRFSHGEQWPAEIKMQRQLDKRPCLTINKTDAMVRQVVNEMRQQRPRCVVHPVGDGADQQAAELREELLRHIQVQSNADLAYDTAADHQVRMGLGFWRILADYIDEESFDQELYIKPVRNPFSVYMDPSAVDPSGCDAEWVIIVDRIKKEEFERRYPNATVQDFTSAGQGDSRDSWSTKEETMIAEYWRCEYIPDTLFKLADGTNQFKSDLPEGKKVGDFVGKTIIIDSRESCKKIIRWSKVTKTQELETAEWRGKYIPIVRVVGNEVVMDGKVVRTGMVNQMIDPQRMYNYWRTQETEFVALAPKAPWLVVEGQIENHEAEWASANIKNRDVLIWKPILDDSGNPTPPPQRIQPSPIPAASVNAAMSASEDIKAVAGMFDPALGAPGQETSGEMVMRRQAQSDKSNFHFYDNLTNSIKTTGLILLDLIPHYYTGTRILRIIGADGSPDFATLNEQTVDGIMNDMSVGRYDVVMETGPGYDTKRQENVDRMMSLIQFMPKLAEVAGDILVGQMDWPGADQLAERLKMANPLASVHDKIPEDIDPKARPIITNLMGQMEQLKQQIQVLTQEKQAKLFGVLEREKAITDREMGKQQAEAEKVKFVQAQENARNTEDNQTWMHETYVKATAGLQEVMIDTAADLKMHRIKDDNRGEPRIGSN